MVDIKNINVTITDDTVPPTAELVSPPDGNFNTNGVTFICNATDNAELKSVAFFWNHSGSWVEDTINNVEGSGTFIQTAFSKSGLNDGNYIWGCRACDTAQNCVFSPTNRTIMIDTIAPVVTLYSPVAQVYTTGTVELNYSASDTNRDSCWYEISGSNTTLPGCANATLSLADGSYTIIVWVNDTATNINGAGAGFSVDTTAPEAFLGPVPATFSNTSATDITFSLYCTDNIAVDELHLFGEWGGWGLKAANSTPHNNTNWEVSINGIPEGTWIWGSWCNDTASLADWSDNNNTITVDRTAPVIALASPTPADSAYLPANSFTVNVTHTEAHPDTIILYLSGNSPQAAQYSGGDSSFSTPALADGAYTYYVWVNDTAGNPAQTATRTVTIDTTNPLVEFIASTPASGTSIGIGSSLYINVSHTELNQGSIILEVNGANETHGYMTENFTTITKSWGLGTYNYRVYANDSAGNLNSTEMRNVTFIVPPPPPPPSMGGYVPSRSGGYSPPVCKEDWNCTSWSTECVNFEYTRTCTDVNSCGTDENKPAEEIACAMSGDDSGYVSPSTICTPGALKCSGSNLVSCNPVGTAWNLVVACENGCQNAACKDQPDVFQSGGELGLTGLFVGQGANALAIAAGVLVLLGGAYYYFRIRRFKVL